MLGAIALIAAVVGIRSLMPGDTTPSVTADRVPTLDKALPESPQQYNGTVVFVRSSAVSRTLYLSLGGRSEAEVGEVAFGAAGKVTTTPGKEGDTVDAGELLCGLDVDGAGAHAACRRSGLCAGQPGPSGPYLRRDAGDRRNDQ